MGRDEAYGLSWEALNLAQDLNYHELLRNPKDLKDKTDVTNLLEELEVSNKAFGEFSKRAYELTTAIGDFADKYFPVDGEQ